MENNFGGERKIKERRQGREVKEGSFFFTCCWPGRRRGVFFFCLLTEAGFLELFFFIFLEVGYKKKHHAQHKRDKQKRRGTEDYKQITKRKEKDKNNNKQLTSGKANITLTGLCTF